MALVTRSTDADIDMTSALYAPQLPGLIAGEALDAAAPCHISATDGKVYMSNATAADADAEVDGVNPVAALAGQPVTLFGASARFFYSDGNLTPGATYYLAATDGRLDDAATTGDAVGIAKAVDAYVLRVTRDS